MTHYTGYENSKLMNMKILDFIQLDSTRLVDEALLVFKDKASADKKRVLELTTDATHSGKIINNRVYRGKHVKDGAKTFFKTEGGAQFNKPFLRNHDSDTDAIGRIVDAKYLPTLSGKRWEEDHVEPTDTGSGLLRTTSHITDQDAIEKFLDGRYATVSQASTTDGAFCSTCTKAKGDLVPIFASWADSEGDTHECDHYPGDMVDGKKNYLITGRLFYDELSQVNRPADDLGIHVGMKVIQDHIQDSTSFFGMLKDKISEIEIIKTPIRGRILDSEGKLISSLCKDEYVSTKTISIPDTVTVKDKEVNNTSVSKEDQSVSAGELADARVMSHFKAYFNLKLSDEESKKLDILKSGKLTDTQKAELRVGLYLTDSLPFKLTSQETLDSCKKYADRIFTSPEALKTYMSALEKQADSEKLAFNKGTNKMDEAQAKALLDSLEAHKLKVADAEKKLSEVIAERDTLKKEIVDARVKEVISLRAQVGYADCANFDSKTPEDKTAVTERYAKMSDELLAHVLQEAKDNIKAGVVIAVKLADTKIENPLTVKDKKDDTQAVVTAPIVDAVQTPVIVSKTSIL